MTQQTGPTAFEADAFENDAFQIASTAGATLAQPSPWYGYPKMASIAASESWTQLAIALAKQLR